jgi:hypothetical protein
MACGFTTPVGMEPAEKALKRPPPSRFMIASAMIERAELPVHRKRTLSGASAIESYAARAPQHPAGAAGAGSSSPYAVASPKVWKVSHRSPAGSRTQALSPIA